MGWRVLLWTPPAMIHLIGTIPRAISALRRDGDLEL